MINIAFYCSDIRILAGTERSTFTVANELASNENYNILIISNEGDRSEVKMELDPRIEVINLHFVKKRLGYFKNLYKLRKILKNYDIKIFISVEIISVFFTLPLFILEKKLNIKFIAWEHFNYTVNLNYRLRDFCRKFAARYAAGIVVLTEKDVELWKTHLKINGYITNISNPSPFPLNSKEYNLNSKNIIAIGRLVPQKGFDLLIENWNLLKQNGLLNKGWKLQIIGSGPDEEKLTRMVDDFLLNDDVEFISNTNSISDFYENASFLVMTSRFEGLPMTLIEAQSFGLPIVAYDCLTGPAQIISKSSGFLVENGNKEQFLNSLGKLINDSKLRKEMSNQARIESQNYLPSNIVKRWIKFFENVI